jgi:hypothetical protein
MENTDDLFPLLNTPDGEVKLTVSGETFTVNFRYDDNIKEHIEAAVLSETFTNLKTRDDLIDFYKNRSSYFLPGSSSMKDNNENVYVKAEYMLAQECFSDRCDSQTRREVLQLVVDKQEAKYDHEQGVYRSDPIKTGIFLMAVILVKERINSAKYIDAQTLQETLLSLNSNILNEVDLSNSILESSENFLINSKR